VQGAEIHELVIDECGDIPNWPDEFFGDLNDDLAVIAAATAQRRALCESAGAEQPQDTVLDGAGRLIDGHPAPETSSPAY
jgi:hypothetical protein